jgi:two-component system chemotaxis response regulator CheY
MNKKILIVDDAPFMRTRIKNLLNQNHYQVIEAENGLQAVEKYREEKPDLVLMDITMPEMDGITALKELKKIDANCKIAMLSAMGQEKIVIEALKCGAKDFILKPFQSERVINTINKLLK